MFGVFVGPLQMGGSTNVLVGERGHVTGWLVAVGLQAFYRCRYVLWLALDGDG
jgi:uncharacterized membrane protein